MNVYSKCYEYVLRPTCNVLRLLFIVPCRLIYLSEGYKYLAFYLYYHSVKRDINRYLNCIEDSFGVVTKKKNICMCSNKMHLFVSRFLQVF